MGFYNCVFSFQRRKKIVPNASGQDLSITIDALNYVWNHLNRWCGDRIKTAKLVNDQCWFQCKKRMQEWQTEIVVGPHVHTNCCDFGKSIRQQFNALVCNSHRSCFCLFWKRHGHNLNDYIKLRIISQKTLIVFPLRSQYVVLCK